MMVNQMYPQQQQQPTYTTQFRLVTSQQPYYTQPQYQTLQRPPKARSLNGSDTMFEPIVFQPSLSQSQQIPEFTVQFDGTNEYDTDQNDTFISNTNNSNGLTISHLSK